MKALSAILGIFAATIVIAAEMPAHTPVEAPTAVTGEVLETKDVEGYTYLRLKTANGETWAAVPKTTLKQGAKVTIENTMVMNNFQSKALKRIFPKIVFGTLGGGAAGASGEMTAAHAGMAAAPAVGDVHVAKATGANARTVAEILTQGAALKDKPVLVRGKVVKYNAGIMGKNWIHLRDGSGAETNNTNDLLVTTTGQAKVGDVVTVKGVVHTDKDFGAGYAYKVLVEEATLQAQ